MPETKYDAAVLQKYADALYSQARWVIFSTTFVYGLVTFVGAFLLVSGFDLVKHPNASLSVQPGVFMLAVIGAALGFGVGQRKAFLLKLEAQKLLCERQVELNTRTATKSEVMVATAGSKGTPAPPRVLRVRLHVTYIRNVRAKSSQRRQKGKRNTSHESCRKYSNLARPLSVKR